MTAYRVPRRAFCLRLPGDLHVRLKVLAALRHVSTNTLICQALETWADVLERGHYNATEEPESPPPDSKRRPVKNRRSGPSRARKKRSKR